MFKSIVFTFIVTICLLTILPACGTQKQTEKNNKIVEIAKYQHVSNQGIKLSGEVLNNHPNECGVYQYNNSLYYGVDARCHNNSFDSEEYSFNLYRISKSETSILKNNFSSLYNRESQKDKTIYGYLDNHDFYFVDEDGNVAKYNIEEELIEAVEIGDEIREQFYAINGIIYYHPIVIAPPVDGPNDTSGDIVLNNWKKYNDGKITSAFSDGKGILLTVSGTDIYYLDHEKANIWKLDTITGTETLFCKNFLGSWGDTDYDHASIYDDYLACEQSDKTTIYKFNEKSSKKLLQFDSDEYDIISIQNEKAYFVDVFDHSLLEYNLKTQKKHKILTESDVGFLLSYCAIIDDTWIYLTDEYGNLWRMPQDGSSKPDLVLKIKE